MTKPLIVVTGKNGQLGWELQQLQAGYNLYDFLFVDRDQLDLGDAVSIRDLFEKNRPSYFINCAAYTAVDKAETEQSLAYAINAEAVNCIAEECSRIHCRLIHISTDYVFDGKGKEPYVPLTKTDPVNYYGYTKWLGEKFALKQNPQTIIIRTSWLYSSHGNNFVKTMLRLMKERNELKVVSDQLGSPTFAADLADAILKMIDSLAAGNEKYGIYHYSNAGIISWYDFANAIRDIAGLSCNVLPIKTESYPTPAKRPSYSAMNTADVANDFGIPVKEWKDSLQNCMQQLL